MAITQQELDAQNAACAALIPGLSPSYGYAPSEAAGIAFVTIFSLMAIAHTGLAVWKREWWCLVFTVGAICKFISFPKFLIFAGEIRALQLTVHIGELLGWGARLWAAECPYNNTAFLMQISTLIFGTF